MFLTPIKSRTVDSSNCSICLDTLNSCPLSPSTKEELVDAGLYVPESPNGDVADWDVEIGCGCAFHHRCFVRYISMKLEDRSSLTLPPCNGERGSSYGVLCPKTCRISKAQNNTSLYTITREEIATIAEQGRMKRAMNRLKESEVQKLDDWVYQCSDVAETALDDSELDPLLLDTTKPCPCCGFRASHPHYHGCHHISPFGGCRNCKSHYCFRCLKSERDNGGPPSTACDCGHWSNYCWPMKTRDDVLENLVFYPYPHDKRCGCVICSDCAKGLPCSECRNNNRSGDCAVCRGLIPPGPRSLAEIEEFKRQVIEDYKDTAPLTPFFMELREACQYSNWSYFESLDSGGSQKRVKLPIAESDELGNYLLHYAAMNSSKNAFKIIRRLLREDASVLATNLKQESPLQLAFLSLATTINRSTHSKVNIEGQVRAQQQIVIEMLQTVPFYHGLYDVKVEGFTLLDWANKHEKRLSCLVSAFPEEHFVDEQRRTMLYRLLERQRWDLANSYLDHINPSNPPAVGIIVGNVPLLALIASPMQEKASHSLSLLRTKLLSLASREYRIQHSSTILLDLLHYLIDETVPVAALSSDVECHHPVLQVHACEGSSGKALHLTTGLVNLCIALCNDVLSLSDSSLRRSYLLHRDTEGNTALHLCAMRPELYPNPFQLLVKGCAELVNVTNGLLNSPLHLLASQYRAVECWHYLMELAERGRGREREVELMMFQQNVDGLSPFLSLCDCEEPRRRSHSTLSVDSDSGGQTETFLGGVMHFVFQRERDSKALSQLLERVDKLARRTVVHALVRANNVSALQCLIALADERTVSLPLLSLDCDGNTCLHCACLKEELDFKLSLSLAQACSKDRPCAPRGKIGKTALQFLLTRQNNAGDSVFHILARRLQGSLSPSLSESAVKLLKKFAEMLLAETVSVSPSLSRLSSLSLSLSPSRSLNDVLFTRAKCGERERESVVEMLCASLSLSAVRLVEFWLRERVLSLSDEKVDASTALMHIFRNESVRASDSFHRLALYVLNAVRASGTAALTLSRRVSVSGDSLLHCLARERHLFALRYLLLTEGGETGGESEKRTLSLSPEATESLLSLTNHSGETLLHCLFDTSRTPLSLPLSFHREGGESPRNRSRSASVYSDAHSDVSETESYSYSVCSSWRTDFSALSFGERDRDCAGEGESEYEISSVDEDEEQLLLDILSLTLKDKESVYKWLVSLRDKSGQSLLHLSLRYHYVRLSDLLLSLSFEFLSEETRERELFREGMPGEYGLTYWLFKHPHFFSLFNKFCAVSGDDVDFLASRMSLSLYDNEYEGMPLLIYLCKGGKSETTEPLYALIQSLLLLYDEAISLSVVDPTTGDNALHIACEQDNVILLETLLKSSRNKSISLQALCAKNHEGLTPLCIARDLYCDKCLTLLENEVEQLKSDLGATMVDYSEEMEAMDT